MGDERFSLRWLLVGVVVELVERWGGRTFSSISWSCDSVRCSSSVALVGMFAVEAYCEYVWKRVSVCVPS